MPWKEQIEKKCQTVGKLFADKNWTELAKCYTEDASLMPPHGVRYAGRDNIIEYSKKTWGTGTFDLHAKVEDISGDEDWAFCRGSWVKKDSSDKVTESGNFINVYKKCNNDYQIYLDLWNGGKRSE